MWAADIYGCICFLVASQISYMAVRGQRSTERRITMLNLAGSVAPRRRAARSYTRPAPTQYATCPSSNIGTCVGALCFLAGAILLLPKQGQARVWRGQLTRTILPSLPPAAKRS